MNMNAAAFSIEEAAEICRLHHSRIREMIRHTAVKIGHKPVYAIWLTAREIVALIVARELVCAGYPVGRALDMAHGVVTQYDVQPPVNHRSAFPLAGQDGAVRVGADAVTGQVGTKIVIDLPALWSLVEHRCGSIYETPQ